MITFLLGWCVLSVIGTVIALGLIRTGKQRQPESDGVPVRETVVPSATHYKV